jgi:hypothetical protein
MLLLEVAEVAEEVVQRCNLLLQLYLPQMVPFNWDFLRQVLLYQIFFYQEQLS